MSKIVIHRDGKTEPFRTEKIIDAIKYLFDGNDVSDPFMTMFKVIKNFEIKLPDQITTEQIDHLLLKSLEWLITEDPDYDTLAVKQLIKIINKSVENRFDTFADYIKHGVESDILDKRMLDFDLATIEWAIDYGKDNLWTYFGLDTLKHRYLVRDHDKNLLEKSQWMRMRVAMWLSYNEPNKEEFAIKVYNKMSSMKYLHATPTLMNSWTKHHQLISCFIWVVEDDLMSIMDKAKESALYVKYTWWVAMSMTKLRASWSPIKTINTSSCGPIPFIKIFDTTINSVVVWGKRAANIVVYLEPWHYNIHEFLDLKETNWNDALRARKINTALWIPDLFMKRVKEDGKWYLFDPKEVIWLDESYGEEFEKIYNWYQDKADNWELKLFKIVNARDLYKDILIRMAKTGNYWFNFKDRHNETNQAKPYWLIHSTNMCTEISIANRPDSTAICTLASVNLSKFVKKPTDLDNNKEYSYEEKLSWICTQELIDTTKLAIRALDNVIDINFFPTEESKKNGFDLRPLGLGVMWFGDMLLQLGIDYSSKDAVRLSSHLAKNMYESALQESRDLTKERGTFGDYHEGYGYEPRRNILLLSIAPTASISNIAGTSSCIEPYYSNIYSRETTSGKFTIIVKELINNLKAKWMRNEQVRKMIMINQWSIQNIDELDWIIDKTVYRTVYESDPLAQIDIAAARQEYIDQSISRNIYGKPEWRDKLWDVYMYAREQGLKSTYYCFIEKDIQWEKYTQQINKRGVRRWFGNIEQSIEAKDLAIQEGKDIQEPIKEVSEIVSRRWFGFGTVVWAPVMSTGWDEDNQDKCDPTEEIVYWGLTKSEIESKLREEKWDEYVEKLKKWELYKEGQCPVNPFEKVMCDSCQ